MVDKYNTNIMAEKEYTSYTQLSDGSYARKVILTNSLITDDYDYIGVTYPSGTQEVYTFKKGGSSGTVVGTITVNFTDSTKAVLSSVEKT